MLQDQLFQPQKSPLMRNLLPNLNHSLPSILRSQFRTTRTLTGMYDECQDESLLKDRMGQDFLLDGDFDFQTTGMGFGPYE